MIPLQFKKAVHEDLFTILNLFKNAAQAMKDKKIDHWQHWLDVSENRVNQIKDSIKASEFYLVYEDETLIGMFKILDNDPEYWGERQEKAKYVHALVVSPKFKGQNFGKRILDQIESDLKANKVDLFRLDCNAHNPWLCKYYESIGFLKVGEKVMPWSTNNLYEKVVS